MSDVPKLLCADEWEFSFSDHRPPEGKGWCFVAAQPCEQSYHWQSAIMVVWARLKPPHGYVRTGEK